MAATQTWPGLINLIIETEVMRGGHLIQELYIGHCYTRYGRWLVLVKALYTYAYFNKATLMMPTSEKPSRHWLKHYYSLTKPTLKPHEYIHYSLQLIFMVENDQA